MKLVKLSLAAAALLSITTLASTASAQSTGAQICQHVNYGGKCLTIQANQNIPDLRRLNFNDEASSLRVAPNCTAMLYEHINYGGKMIRFDESSSPDFTRINFNDTLSSIKVTCRTPPRPTPPVQTTGHAGPAAQVCQHVNFGGKCYDLKPGQNIADFRRANFNDEASSLRVRSNCTVTLYEHINFTGKSYSFDGKGSADFRRFNFNDTLSSMKVMCKKPVTVYEHINYQGRAVQISRYDHPNLVQLNFNDQASSVRVGYGCTATLYEHVDYRGRSIRMERDHADFRQFRFNDTLSSVRVSCPMR